MIGMNYRNPEKVYLHIYDLHPSNSLLYPVGLGFYHSGVEVYGREYTFGEGGGVIDTEPFEVLESNGIFLRETILLGETWNKPTDIQDILSLIKSKFDGNAYNVLTRNCNSFSNYFCKSIFGYNIPGYVNRLAGIGKCFSPIINKINNTIAPNNNPISISNSFIPFSGKGNKL
jgi:deubiquitinase DESI2